MYTQKLLILLSFCILLSSCINSDNIKVGEIENFSITKFSGNSIQCKSSIEIVNNSVWSITLKNKEMLIFAGDQKLGTVNFNEALKIGANTSKIYNFQFTVEITNVELGFASLMGNILGNSKEYRIKGKVSACSMLICKNIEVNEVLVK